LAIPGELHLCRARFRFANQCYCYQFTNYLCPPTWLVISRFYCRKIDGKKYIWKATRTSVGVPFSEISEVSELNDPCNTVWEPSISPDGLTIYYSAKDGSETSIFRATRTSTDEPFGNIELLDFCLLEKEESHPYVTPDGTGFYFFGGWGSGLGGIWETHLESTAEECLPM